MDEKGRKETGPVVFSMPNTQCIWSKAGVIESTECTNAFDCLGCSIEKTALGVLEKECRASGKAGACTGSMMSIMPQGQCRHMLSGRLSYCLCSHDSCANCPVEQMIEDSGIAPTKVKSEHADAQGYEIAKNYYYHRAHTWARVEYGGVVRIGLDDFALRLLGQQDAIEAPLPGSKVSQGGPAVILKRDENKAAVICPVDGVVLEVNQKVLEKAGLANASPYEDGWLMLIQPTNLKENLKNLFFDAEGKSWIEDSAMTLNAMLASEGAFSLVAAGTETASDVVKDAPEIGWKKLVEEFLE